jgi:cellulose synthase/poly-beta-1,6-N-acetylglucosamine synthase-like glycosyltransferase
VTVQLPLFNEKYVVKRLIEAVCALEHPRDRLEIQVLDDSIDETRATAKNLVTKLKQRGFNIEYINRESRTGFKAGALEAGLQVAKGEFLAIFDADFVPNPDFIKKTLPYFTDPKVGLVQARWGHINRDYSLLTRIQSMFLDGHFVIEHLARNRSGRFFNFNGTAGIWRKEAIIEAGGWQHDTLTEDLDLSYRAQLAGWNFIYSPAVVAPAELPVEINAYKSQQHRWAKGSVQTAKKLLPVIFKSALPLFVKIEASIHLISNLTYLCMTIPSILMPIVLHLLLRHEWQWMIYIYFFVFSTATLSVMCFYAISQRECGINWKKQIPYVPVLMSLGIGLSINNAKAVLEALFNYATEFKRTPKYNIEDSLDQWRNKKYRASISFQPFVEILFGTYFTVASISLMKQGLFVSIPFLLLFQFGFMYIGFMSFAQAKFTDYTFGQLKIFLQQRLLFIMKKI